MKMTRTLCIALLYQYQHTFALSNTLQTFQTQLTK